MALVEGALAAFASMLFYGIGDFLGKKAVDAIGDFPALLYSHVLGFIPIAVYALVFAQIPLISTGMAVLMLVTALSSVVAWLLFYRGLSRGLASIVVPVAGAWGMVTALLALIFLGEQPTIVQLVGIVVIVAGVTLTSLEIKSLRKKAVSAGVALAIAAMFFFGVTSFLSDYVVEGVGVLAALVLMRFLSIVFLSASVPFRKTRLRLPPRSVWLLILAVAVAEVLAVLAFFIGIDIGMVSIVAPIVAAYTPVTVILAHLFLGERIFFNQKIGIVLTVVGLIAVSLI